MDRKYIILIILIAIIALIGGYFLLNGQTQPSEKTTLILSQSAYMEVPKDASATNNVDKKGVFFYVDNSSSINVTSCSNLSEDSSVAEMNKLKNSFERGSKKLKGDDVVVYLKDGIYTVFVKNTQYNDTILLQSTNKNLLIQCWESIKFHSPTDKLKFNETTSDSGSSSSGSVVNAAEKTKKVVSKNTSPSTSSSSSSQSSSYSSGFGYSSYGSGSISKGSSSGGSGGGASAPSFGEF